MLVSRLGGSGDRFGDFLCVDRANLSCVSGQNQFTHTKFSRPVTQFSKLGCLPFYGLSLLNGYIGCDRDVSKTLPRAR